jgi:hypothetical protein
MPGFALLEEREQVLALLAVGPRFTSVTSAQTKVQTLTQKRVLQLRERVAQVNARVNGLLVEKGQLQQERIASEEEKLKVSKVLIDLQIENASLLEQAVDKGAQFACVARVTSTDVHGSPDRERVSVGAGYGQRRTQFTRITSAKSTHADARLRTQSSNLKTTLASVCVRLYRVKLVKLTRGCGHRVPT